MSLSLGTYGQFAGSTVSGNDDIGWKYGAEADMPGRWRRVVDTLDKHHPEWRKLHKLHGSFLGDAVEDVIKTLTAHLKKKLEAQKRVDAAKTELANAEALLKALS